MKAIVQFEEITVCKHCGAPTKEVTYEVGNGWDGHSVCTGCGIVEPDKEYKFFCNNCEQICDEEKCSCNLPKNG